MSRVAGIIAIALLATAVSAQIKNIQNFSTLDSWCAAASIWEYETVPLEPTGAGCIGGSGGADFSIHEYGTTVQEIRAWTGGEANGLKAVFVKLFSGTTKIFGSVPANDANAQIVLSPGETIVGTMELYGNGIGTRTGSIRFKTSKGQEFNVGDKHTPYLFPSGDSFLTGFFGRSGSDIDQLGFIMMKTPKSGRMFNVQYPTIENYKEGLAPQVYKATFCNDATSAAQSQTATFTKSEGQSYSWENEISFEFGMSFSVEAGVPEVEKQSVGFNWKVGTASKFSKENNNVRTQQMEFPVSVPARSRVVAQFTWFDSKVNLPYTAALEYTYNDGSVATFDVHGVFNGAFISQVDANFHTEDLREGEYCL